MKTLQFLPLVLAFGAMACGDGEVGGPPDDSFDEARPYIYSEQPSAPGEKPPTALERPPSEADADPIASPFGLDGNGLPSSGSTPPPSDQDSVDCVYSVDSCYYCNSYDECVACWEDSATAETACSGMFP